MRSPLVNGPLMELETVDSTQNVAAELLKSGGKAGAVLALEQTEGRGRFGRVWHSPPGDCLAVSLIFRDYAGHSKPYLVGMALAVAAAQALECTVQWPNDLTFQRKKVGGILTELMPDHNGNQVPIVGLGINLNQAAFPPEIANFATSLRLAHGHGMTPNDALQSIMRALQALPEIQEWSELEPLWTPLDQTPGKLYKLQDGREAVARAVGPNGELIALIDGQESRILAADALLD